MADLDQLRFALEYLPAAVAPEVLAENGRELRDQMIACRFLSADGVPTVAGILVLGRDPCAWIAGAYTQFVRSAGTRLGETVIGQKEIDGADGQERAFRITGAFSRLIANACQIHHAGLALVDVGPNLGAINRAALLACDLVVIPLGPDIFSLQGLRNVGSSLHEWRKQWMTRLPLNPDPTLLVPGGRMEPAGYIVMRHAVRLDRPARAYGRWMRKMPGQYATKVVKEPEPASDDPAVDPNCLAMLRDYRSLMPLAQEAHKPMFMLKPGDGAFGGHQNAVVDCYRDFRNLTDRLLERCAVAV